MNAKKAALVAAIAAAIFMILPLRSVVKSVKMKKHGILTEATVSDRNTRGKGLTRVTVTFNTSDGTEVTATTQKRNYVSKGDKVEIWYDKADPQKIDFGDTIGYNTKGVLVTGFISLICFYLFIRSFLKDSANKKLINKGMKIFAEYVSVDRNEKYRMGDKNPWVIKCRWTDNRTNKEYYFRSKDYTIDPSPYLAGRNHIDVYVDPGDPGKFYMDSSFMPEGNITMG
ncbi:MAG TPA: DUF3592 domain-containing protein [Bacteroidales bacterium]|nr:DUF3592 domain-containing protein [Bacteroidales bacterium]